MVLRQQLVSEGAGKYRYRITNEVCERSLVQLDFKLVHVHVT